MEAHDAEPAATQILAISNAAARIAGRAMGRDVGPARTFVQEDLVTILVRETIDPGYQRMMRDDLVATVEVALKRDVIAFMSSSHVDPDVAVETFLLAPLRAD